MDKITFGRTYNKAVKLTGGINEQLTSLELKPGELIDASNYEESDGEYPGYSSIPGFERFDGKVRQAEYPIGSGNFENCIYPSDALIVFNTDGSVKEYGGEAIRLEDGSLLKDSSGDVILTGVVSGDNSREYIRSLIEPVPGFGPLLMVTVYNERIYAVREKETSLGSGIGSGFTGLYMITKGTTVGSGGITEVTEWPTNQKVSDYITEPFIVSHGRLAYYPSTDPNTPVFVLTNGISEALIVHRNTTTGVHTVEVITDSNLPTDSNYPTLSIILNNRLYLAYPKGHLFFGNLGDISFDPITGFAGEYYFASSITNMVSAPGNSMVVWLEEGIKILKSHTNDNTVFNGSLMVESFSERSSALPRTATRFLGTMVFLDDRGVCTLDTQDAFGDFKASSVSKRIQNTLQRNLHNVAWCYENRKKNQYIVFFKDGRGITFTFDIEKNMKSAIPFNLKKTMSCYTSISFDDESFVIFGDTNGYIQVSRNRASSFDGSDITAWFSTSFNDYGSRSRYKTFTKILFEMSGDRGTSVDVRPSYDYLASDVPKGATDSSSLVGESTQWSVGVWGTFVWSGNSVDQHAVYLYGLGVNMSVSVSTTGKHRKPHTVHNMTTTYKVRSNKF